MIKKILILYLYILYFLEKQEHLKFTAEPATVFAEAGLQMLSLRVMHRQSSKQETNRASPSPNAISVEK